MTREEQVCAGDQGAGDHANYSGAADSCGRLAASRRVCRPSVLARAARGRFKEGISERIAIVETGSIARQTECLDWLLIVGRRHLEHVLCIYIQHYNRERPHRGLALQPPQAPQLKLPTGGDVQRRDRLGGLPHEYHRAAA